MHSSMQSSESDAASLESFSSRALLRDYFVENALNQLKLHGLRGMSQPLVRRRQYMFAPLHDDGSPINERNSSWTNVQGPSVERPDIIKIDGSRVLILQGSRLLLITASDNGASGTIQGSIEVSSQSRGLLLHGNDGLVIAPDLELKSPLSITSRSSGNADLPLHGRRPDEPITVLFRFSIAGNRLRLVDTLQIQGNFVSARAVDGVARIISRYYSFTEFHYTHIQRKSSSVQTEDALTRAIESSTLADWLPWYSAQRVQCTHCDAQESGRCEFHGIFNQPLLRFENVYREQGAFSGFNFTVITTLSLSGVVQPCAMAIVADAARVLSTGRSLYMATTAYRQDLCFDGRASIGLRYKTTLHKFAFTETADKIEMQYRASGIVNGSLLKSPSPSMHKFKDRLFVATTDCEPSWRSQRTFDSGTSMVSAFQECADGRLHKVDEVRNLDDKNCIFAIRYIAAIAVLSPNMSKNRFLMLDLCDPGTLREIGDLQTPGFNTYLHLISTSRILAVSCENTKNNRIPSVKVSLFDVSDVANPNELSSWSLKGSFCSAEWDHRAFFFWPTDDTAILPVSLDSRDKSECFTGSIVLHVTDSSMTERGRIVHTLVPGTSGDGVYITAIPKQPLIKRNFVLGEEHLWSLSSGGLQVNDINTLERTGIVRVTKPAVDRIWP